MHAEKSWKQKRASLPKVRTGCMTCKTRRVKCDERKPLCLRCEKASFECHGYEENPPPKRRGKPIEQIKEEVARIRSTALLPRPSSASCASQPTVLLSLRPGPTVSTLQGRDIFYYDLFRHQLVRDLSVWSPSDFWERIVLLETERDESVRESVLAIGALAQAIYFDAQPLPESARPNLLLPWCGETVVNEHHREALRHHTKAVSLFRASAKFATPRSVIIISMLLVAFELLQGNVAMAERLLLSVITLLRGSSKFLQQGHDSHHILACDQQEEDLDEIDHILPCLSVLSGHSHFAISQRNLLGSLPSTAAIKEIPDWRSPTPLSWVISRWGRFYTRGMTFIDHGVSLQLQNVALTLEQESELNLEQASFLKQLHQWRKVLKRYPNQKALRLAHIQWLKIYVSISSLLDRTDLTWDNFVPEMEELNEYAADLLRDPETKNRIGFTLCDGSGMIGAIGMVISKARDHEIRMRAAALLKLVETREGAWDPKTMVVGLSWLALMEEQARAQLGYIPPQQRWYWVHGKWDLGNDVLQAEYLGVIPNEFGEMVSKTILLDKEPIDVCAELGCAENHAVAW